jgi:hypothetical protein
MIVKPSQVEAALAFKDGDHVAQIFWEAEMARLNYEEARAEAEEGFNAGSVPSRKNRALLLPKVKELARAKVLAETEERRLKAKLAKADAIIELYRTESANAREGVL